jgi:predicted O-methyltransferase YrrM
VIVALLSQSIPQSVALGLIVAVVLLPVLLLQMTHYRRLHRMMEFVRKDIEKAKMDQRASYVQIEALFSMFSLIDVRRSLPPMRGFAASPDFSNLILDFILDHRPQNIMEIGSGVSTLIAGYGLERIGGGRLVAIDQEEQYASRTRQMVAEHGLDGNVSVHHAPLGVLTLAGKTWNWYLRDHIADLESIDLLIVDGPVGGRENPLERYPALPVVYPKLSKNAVIILDDANRPGEREVVAMWLREFSDLRLTHIDTEKGTAVLTRETADYLNH